MLKLVLDSCLGGWWKGAPAWEKKHTADCCVFVTSAELYTEWIEIASAHSLARVLVQSV